MTDVTVETDVLRFVIFGPILVAIPLFVLMTSAPLT